MSRRPDDGLKGREAIEEIDRRLGGLLGPLAEGLAKLVDAAEKAQGSAQEATIETGRGPMKVRTGLSVRMGALAGQSRAGSGGRDPAKPVNPATAARPVHAAASAPQAAEPHYDVFEDAAGWSLTADMPGAAEHEIAVSVADGRVIVETTGSRRWRLATDAPDWVRAPVLRVANGVVELTAARSEGAA
jgi:HSP20 family molecular chaperone IbpA